MVRKTSNYLFAPYSANHQDDTYSYRVFLLTSRCTKQLYCTESLHLLQHPVMAAVFRTVTQETRYTLS